MCILSYIPENVTPNATHLLNGGLYNPHGHGWAIVDNRENRIVVGKDMDIEKALDAFLVAREKLSGPALFHSRWATHGPKTESNCHPFYVGHNPKTVVGHNGILPCEPAKGDKRSDTKLFAEEILSTKYRRLDKARAFEALTNYIGRWNKLVILTVDPRYARNAYIVNEAAGEWDTDTGIWHSNLDFLGDSRWDYRGYGGKEDPGTGDACEICGGEMDPDYVCTLCSSCGDCWNEIANCLCYRPESLQHEEFDSFDHYAESRRESTADYLAAVQLRREGVNQGY